MGRKRHRILRQAHPLTAAHLAVTQAEHMAASLKADESLRAAVAEVEANIANFAKKSRRRNWEMKNSHGATVRLATSARGDGRPGVGG